MSDNYIIEARSEAAGIVVRDRNRFRFFAASSVYRGLEGRLFKTPREAERAAIRLVEEQQSRCCAKQMTPRLREHDL